MSSNKENNALLILATMDDLMNSEEKEKLRKLLEALSEEDLDALSRMLRNVELTIMAAKKKEDKATLFALSILLRKASKE